ncbi:MAG TPA: DUF4235 domain-containing protein [Solirubrobacteraceae bacterium]|nr:DUF4235 domain-containing protein [Solirubrobacteraceae bacterium]
MKLLYKPFGIITALIAARIGKAIFTSIWSRIDDREPPETTAPSATMPKVVGAKVLEAATMAGVGAAADRISAKFFHHLTGAWPGSDPEPIED